MSEQRVAAKQPIPVKLEVGKTYAWCRCGLSESQPFCNGARETTDLRPLVWQAAEAKEAWLCQCKHAKNPPYCAGTHKTV